MCQNNLCNLWRNRAFTLLATGALLWRTRLAELFARLIRTNPLFTVSLLSIVLWSGFVIAWEPANSNYWVLNFFPALVCLGILLPERRLAWRVGFHGAFLLLIMWNGYFNHVYDSTYSRNFPEPLLASIEQHVGQRDIFNVLAQDGWFGGMDYELRFSCLQHAPRNPGIAILQDFHRGRCRTPLTGIGADSRPSLSAGHPANLLVHDGILDAVMLDTILKDFHITGVKFITVDEALTEAA